MKNLSKKEEQLMGYLWKQKKCFLNELSAAYPNPKPTKTTLATLLKRLQQKGFVEYQAFGNSRQYSSLIERDEYFSDLFAGLVSQQFNNSIQELGQLLIHQLKLKKEDLESLKKMIEQEMNSRQNKEAVFF